MKRVRYYSGVWSNGKKTFDLDNLNTKYELDLDSNSYIIYVTPSGTIIEKYSTEIIDDYYCDIGAITHTEYSYNVLGRNFKKIKEKGNIDENYKKFVESFEQEN